jgi:hypothetical protein
MVEWEAEAVGHGPPGNMLSRSVRIIRAVLIGRDRSFKNRTIRKGDRLKLSALCSSQQHPSSLLTWIAMLPSEMTADPWEYRLNSCKGESLVDNEKEFASKTLQNTRQQTRNYTIQKYTTHSCTTMYSKLHNTRQIHKHHNTHTRNYNTSNDKTQ